MRGRRRGRSKCGRYEGEGVETQHLNEWTRGGTPRRGCGRRDWGGYWRSGWSGCSGRNGRGRRDWGGIGVGVGSGPTNLRETARISSGTGTSFTRTSATWTRTPKGRSPPFPIHTGIRGGTLKSPKALMSTVPKLSCVRSAVLGGRLAIQQQGLFRRLDTANDDGAGHPPLDLHGVGYSQRDERGNRDDQQSTSEAQELVHGPLLIALQDLPERVALSPVGLVATPLGLRQFR